MLDVKREAGMRSTSARIDFIAFFMGIDFRDCPPALPALARWPRFGPFGRRTFTAPECCFFAFWWSC